eukprot:6203841-Pleurochrysis_carterae.AAC.1
MARACEDRLQRLKRECARSARRKWSSGAVSVQNGSSVKIERQQSRAKLRIVYLHKRPNLSLREGSVTFQTQFDLIMRWGDAERNHACQLGVGCLGAGTHYGL